MAITKRLVMSFKTDGSDSMTLSIDNPKEDITEEEIKECMDLVVEKNIFLINGANVASSIEAKIVTTDTSDYDLIL